MPSQNFGGNLGLTPQTVYTPANERELLDILRRHRGEELRTVGRLHSWSPVVQTTGVMLDMRRFNAVTIRPDPEHPQADVGAGCQIERLLRELNARGFTAPSQGLQGHRQDGVDSLG